MHSQSESRIGIALGSGAAKGFSHIGVLKALEQMGIFPHVVAGTSMGAFVGAAYTAGKLAALEDWVRRLDNWQVFSLLDINWTLNGGVLGGRKPFNAFFDNIDCKLIEELPLPFTAVATDLHSGQEIWLQSGNLRDAVSASCAIPGLLSPKRLSGRWLVDGAVVNPIPVDVCRAMGATRVIAVDVTEDGVSLQDRRQGQVKKVHSEATPQLQEEPREGEEVVTEQTNHSTLSFNGLVAQGKAHLAQLTVRLSKRHRDAPGMLDTMTSAMDILERRLKRTRLTGSPPDVLIMPKVRDISGMEFARAAEAIEAGEAETLRLRTWLEDVILPA
ncbi:patatin-like phospholipase RssA [Microbulbifer thermotolerans]|uniref:patatin-like phospholipase RssA n=1 Tax=Microbulbifer thermotolerans TaxID=252514 RepID=UPI00224B25AD|nr:patatin-like phospholipase RssA [Microbulbifer thermotolerans]MCX2782898.1 patatin-like phospholipase RssA [Microbulbifer thermotolerans]